MKRLTKPEHSGQPLEDHAQRLLAHNPEATADKMLTGFELTLAVELPDILGHYPAAMVYEKPIS